MILEDVRINAFFHDVGYPPFSHISSMRRDTCESKNQTTD